MLPRPLIYCCDSVLIPFPTFYEINDTTGLLMAFNPFRYKAFHLLISSQKAY